MGGFLMMLDLGVLGVTSRQTVRSYQSESTGLYNLSIGVAENKRKHNDLSEWDLWV